MTNKTTLHTILLSLANELIPGSNCSDFLLILSLSVCSETHSMDVDGGHDTDDVEATISYIREKVTILIY